jgi:outer membrane protein assembly factor BamB/enterochelin esterase-like enzyme
MGPHLHVEVKMKANNLILHRFNFLSVMLLLLVWSLPYAISGSEPGSDSDRDWPRWRGQNHDGKAVQKRVFRFDEGYGLEIAWKKPLGSGYSSVSIADGRAFTMFSDSTFDYMISLDANSGQELWRYKIDSTYIGHDGSHNGPISTPLITGDKVYGLGPKGRLFALDAKTGNKIWSTHLVNDHKAEAPYYGFATSPVFDGDVLIVETGGQDKNAISGFNKNTGELLWTAGADTISYQSPILMNIDGQNQLVCVGDKYLYGLEPETGKILWQYRHNGGGQSTNPVVVDNNKLFLQYKWSESVLLEVTREDGELTAKEVWKSRNIKGTYNVPIYFDGYLYGYSSRFLTCVDTKTGESVWKSRQPGDGFVILVDDHLVIVTKKGTLHIAQASPDGYNEVANLKLFDNVAWTPASFANGRIYTRNLAEIASIDIAKVEQLTTIAEKDVLAPDSKFAQFLKRVKKAQDKMALIDEFMKSHEQFPVLEGDNLVHFIFRGDANDVAIAGDMIGFRREESMKRVSGTDFFYYSAYLEPDARVNYKFVKNFEDEITDPLNARKVPSIFGESSWVSMPQWVRPKHLDEPQGVERGRIDTVQFESKTLESSRRLDIYLPPGYDKSDQRYPVAYVHWGRAAQDWAQMPNTLDNLIGKSVSPIIVVFIPQLQQTRGREFTGDLKEKYAQMFVEELVPFIDSNYRTIVSPETRANIGMAFAGFAAFYSTMKYPSVFGKVSSQSTFLLTSAERELRAVASDSQKQPLQIYLDWGKYDMRSPFEGWSMIQSNRNFAQFLQERGYVLAGGEVNDGFGWASWRNRTDKILETFFPLEKTQINPKN